MTNDDGVQTGVPAPRQPLVMSTEAWIRRELDRPKPHDPARMARVVEMIKRNAESNRPDQFDAIGVEEALRTGVDHDTPE